MNNYKFIVMCGGAYQKWDRPKHLTELKGEPLVARTINDYTCDIDEPKDIKLFERFV